MNNCYRIGPNILQLQSLTNIVTVNNSSANSYPINNIRVTILPTSQPLGFFMDYDNLSPIDTHTTNILDSRLPNTFPKVSKEIGSIPGNITLTVNIILKSRTLVPSPVIVTLQATNNGKVSDVTASTSNGSLKVTLIITYTYVQTAVLYQWNITNCQLNLTNEYE